MQVKVFKNYLTEKECDELNKFTFNSLENNTFSEGIQSKEVNPTNAQMVSRFNRSIVFPDLSKNIMKKIQDKFNLSDNNICKEFHSSGIIVNVTFKGAGVVEHRDGIYKENTFALRCNIVTNTATEGGILCVNRKPVFLEKGDLYILNASDCAHFVTRNVSDSPRILWQFTFDAPNELKQRIFND